MFIRSAIIAMLVVAPLAAAEIQPRGRIHLDYAHHLEDASAFGNGFHLRRARLGLAGQLDQRWSYLVEYDFAENDVQARDVLLRFQHTSAGQWTLGHFKVPFGLDELIGSNAMTFVERALPTTTLTQSRRIGLGYRQVGNQHSAEIMGFGQSINGASLGDEGLGLAARLTFNPIRTEHSLLHVGLALSREQAADSLDPTVRFRTRPESRPSDRRLVDTGVLDQVDWINRMGLEAAWQRGPWSIQGERLEARVQRENQLPGLGLDGWYLSASWILTGESRSYRNGTFGGVRPAGARGAWELALRRSAIDLGDADGGRQNNWTAAVNWYANQRVRFMLNYIAVDVDRNGQRDRPGIVLARAQVAF